MAVISRVDMSMAVRVGVPAGVAVGAAGEVVGIGKLACIGGGGGVGRVMVCGWPVLGVRRRI